LIFGKMYFKYKN